MRACKSYEGCQFDRLLVINDDAGRGPSRERLVVCVCSCVEATIVKVALKSLKKGVTRSCGCFSREQHQLPKGIGGFNELLYRYRKGAGYRGLSFDLNKQEFQTLTQSRCFYCHTPPSQTMSSRSSTLNGLDHSAYTYNGIDRIDNAKGYALDNCVACCGLCNKLKSDLPQSVFIAACKKITAAQS